MGQVALGFRSLLIKLAVFFMMAVLLAWALGGTLWPRAEVADLQRRAGESARLTAENQSLRTLIKAIPTIAGNHITARVIGDAGGTFVHSLLLNAGLNDGVRKGLAVVNAEGPT